MHFKTSSFVLRLALFILFIVLGLSFSFGYGLAEGVPFAGRLLGGVIFSALAVVAGYFFVKYYAVNAVLVGDIFRLGSRLYRLKRDTKTVVVGNLSGSIRRETGGRLVLPMTSSDGVLFTEYVITDGCVTDNLEIPIDASEARALRDGLRNALVWHPDTSAVTG